MPRTLRTVVLHHRTAVSPPGDHFDWLLEDPTVPPAVEHGLWAARVRLAPADWVAAGGWDLEPLPPHRRVYLEYEGPLSAGRGSVSRVDAGTFEPLLWSPGLIRLDLRLRSVEGVVELVRRDDARWHTKQIEE